MHAATDPRQSPPAETATAGGRPVLLATMGVPLERSATVFAVDTAVEGGQSLILANVTRLEPLSLSVRLGYDALEELTPEVSGSLRRSAGLAISLGVRVERLRVRTPRPVTALLELVAERDPAILVFGPDREAIGIRAYQRCVRKICDAAPCLVWTAL